ncbi:hypothetical protein P280DRAFT_465955 [Massarina eburnea CBS 473.64]|uniref:Transcription factor domain-containing protein n=1 Tax=Massarina eburnea CBS 473.64 TaxID=1395130 RepID=A0A6A6SCS9_9PLEO|nr:hypothetical protein P280DRAFT_465955 [Massarina eburnea CBS 473.64]
MDSTGSQDSGRGGGRRSGKKPMEFMFIDSTSYGVNAKPDKAVRSFVMKSARSKKPWSTRQKSPKTDAEPDADSPPDEKRSPSITHSRAGDGSPQGLGSWSDITVSPTLFSSQSYGSPSSRSPSFVVPDRRHSQPYFSSPCNISQCTGRSCGQHHETQTTLAARNGLPANFALAFDCLPVRTSAKIRALIHNFVNVFAGGLVPLDPYQVSRTYTMRWMQNSIQSPTGAPYIYAILTSSALISQNSERDIFEYKTEAIASINSQLQNPKSRVDDNNIAAVLMLLSLEEMKVADNEIGPESDWSKTQRVMHLTGLKTMIEQRGGLVALRSNQCLQTFLLMHAVAHAVTTFERPYAALLDSNGQPPPYDMPTFRAQPSSTRTLRLFQSLKPDPILLDIIGSVVIFIGDLNAWLDLEHPDTLNPLDFQKNMSLLIYRLFDWYKQGEENPRLERNPIDQSICLALIIFLIASQEVRGNYRVMVQVAAQKLKIALGKCLFSWGKATDLLVWMLTIGALATQGTENFAFFKENCGYAYANQGINEMTTPHEMLDRMRKCLWVGSTSSGVGSLQNLDEHAKKLWVAMGYTQEEVIDSIEEGVMSPDRIKTEDVVGGLTGDRFYSNRKKSERSTKF